MFAKRIAGLICALLCMAALIVPQLEDRTLLFEGALSYTFYSLRQNSNAQITVSDAEHALSVRCGIQNITGESAVYADAADAFFQAEKYGAELLFTEKAAGVTNYYYRSARLPDGVALFGKQVNLHIAVREGGACVGSPLIFGGF